MTEQSSASSPRKCICPSPCRWASQGEQWAECLVHGCRVPVEKLPQDELSAAFLVRGEHPIMAEEGFDPNQLYRES